MTCFQGFTTVTRENFEGPEQRAEFKDLLEMSTEPNFVLKWNNFGNVLSYNFYENLKSEKFCDVTLAVEGKFISAHKIILSASSQFFEEMFNLSTERQVIIMSDLKLKDVVNVLEFVYKGEITLGAEDLKSFMETAKVLSLRGIPKNTLENADDISIAPLTPPPSLHDSSEEEATSEANINVKNFVKLEDNSEMQLPETAYQANETLEMKPQSQKKRKRELDRTSK